MSYHNGHVIIYSSLYSYDELSVFLTLWKCNFLFHVIQVGNSSILYFLCVDVSFVHTILFVIKLYKVLFMFLNVITPASDLVISRD